MKAQKQHVYRQTLHNTVGTMFQQHNNQAEWWINGVMNSFYLT